MEDNGDVGSSGSAKSFGDFMKGYDERKASGADGISLLSGAQDSGNSGFMESFAGYFSGNNQEEPSVLLRRTAGNFKSSLFQMGNSLSSSLGNGDIFDTSQSQSGDIETGGDATANTSNTGTSATSGFSDAFGSMSRSQRFKGFVAMLCLSGFFFLLSSFFFPVVLIVPAKFAFSFSLGSVCFMMAFALMQGPTNWIKAVCSQERLPFTISYYGSLFFTFYSAVVWRRYLAIVFFSWVQIGCLIWYGATYLPGGRMGLRIIYNFIVQFATRFMYPCIKASISCFSRLFN
mmetsp:Transcript_7258/g.8252  ORF Transcript_7258/g.8252 Transcript_7258/m.8252 type:complete len:289 (+) Transcript_7258:3-869(+)